MSETATEGAAGAEQGPAAEVGSGWTPEKVALPSTVKHLNPAGWQKLRDRLAKGYAGREGQGPTTKRFYAAARQLNELARAGVEPDRIDRLVTWLEGKPALDREPNLDYFAADFGKLERAMSGGDPEKAAAHKAKVAALDKAGRERRQRLGIAAAVGEKE